MSKFVGTTIIIANIRWKINISTVSYRTIIFQELLKIINLPHEDNQSCTLPVKISAFETSRICLITRRSWKWSS
jgi:hypothetical protein